MNRAALLAAVRDVIEVLDRHITDSEAVAATLEVEHLWCANEKAVRDALDAADEEVDEEDGGIEGETTLEAALRARATMQRALETSATLNRYKIWIAVIAQLVDAERERGDEVVEAVRALVLERRRGGAAIECAECLHEAAQIRDLLGVRSFDDARRAVTDLVAYKKLAPSTVSANRLAQIAELISAQPNDVVGAVERLRDRAVKLAHDVDTHDKYDAEVASVLGDNDRTALEAAKTAMATIKQLRARLEQKDAF